MTVSRPRAASVFRIRERDSALFRRSPRIRPALSFRKEHGSMRLRQVSVCASTSTTRPRYRDRAIRLEILGAVAVDPLLSHTQTGKRRLKFGIRGYCAFGFSFLLLVLDALRKRDLGRCEVTDCHFVPSDERSRRFFDVCFRKHLGRRFVSTY